MKSKSILYLFIAFSLFTASCNQVAVKDNIALDSTIAQGKIIIFHASSLTYPIDQIITDFRKEYPHVEVSAEGSGSRKAAQKITERGRECDVLISSDYQVIKNLLMPNYTDWYIEFAKNEMVIAYTADSKMQSQITSDNWFKVLLDHQVHFGRADPDYDPSGYRAVICIKLAEKYYGEYGIKDQLLFKDKKYIQAMDTDLPALLKKKEIDYAFLYKTVAEQAGLKYVELPDQINLKSASQANYYAMAKTRISGKTPGKYLDYTGSPIRYALTQIRTAPNPVAARAFIKFFIDKNKGLRVLRKDKMLVLDPLLLVPADSTTTEIRKNLSL